jgi:hypothetical protein
VSKAADVYAFGITLWEMYTGRRAFEGIPRALLGHQITKVRAVLCCVVLCCVDVTC